MITCPTCGFDLWSYNSSTRTCKYGHRWGLDGKPAPVQPEYTPTSRTPSTRAAAARVVAPSIAAASAAGAVAAVLVEIASKVLS